MNSLENERRFESALKQTLLEALELELVGEQRGPRLIGRLKTVTRGILLQHGLDGAQVEVSAQGASVGVQVRLPAKGPRVRVIRLTIGIG